MNWIEQQHPGERLIEWGAPAVLAAAAGWAAFALSGSMLSGLATMVTVFGVGSFAMARAGTGERAFRVSKLSVEAIDAAVIDELLLDDPISEVATDSRVVALFETESDTPGALVARISDYLGERSPLAGPVDDKTAGPIAGDAGEALHAALANIRASLR